MRLQLLLAKAKFQLGHFKEAAQAAKDRPERDEEGYRPYYPTAPRAEPRFAVVPRDPVQLAREDAAGFGLVGRSLGFYDSFNDTYGAFILYGPSVAKTEVGQLSEAIFHLTLFGGVMGIPPAPEKWVPAQEYEARIRGFLQNGQADRALTEAKRAVKTHPEAAILHALLGQAHQALWHLEEAASAYEQIQDPQKVWQQIAPIAQHGKDRYTVGQFAYASSSVRRADRILVYYQPAQDILHALTFTAAPDLQEWEPFVDACFSTARLGLEKAVTSSSQEAI